MIHARQALTVLCALLAIGLTVGCAGGSPTSPSDGNGSPGSSAAGVVTARIDGIAWSSGSVARASFNKPAAVGFFHLECARPGSGLTFSVDATSPGTYPIRGAALTEDGRSFTVGGSFGGDGSSGSVTIASLSAVRATGTFQFTAVSAATGARRVVSGGRFDVPMQ